MNTKMLLSVAISLTGLALLLLTTCSAGRKNVDNTTVGDVDWGRYTGQWYEIVRKPHFFEKGLSHVRATYTPRTDGRIDVLNEGIKKGKHKSAHGKARTTDTPGQLMVTFFLFPGEYNIMELGEDYEYAVVGGSNGNYLWILSRTPTMAPATLSGIYDRLEARGYDLSDVIVVEQGE